MQAFKQPLGVSPITDETRMFSALVVRAAKARGAATALDVGCGTGFLAIELAKAGLAVTASDINEAALRATRDNAAAQGVSVRAVKSDLLAHVEDTLDVIAFNAPLGDAGSSAIWHRLKSVGRRIPVLRRLAAELLKKRKIPLRTALNAKLLAQVPAHLSPQGRVYLLVYKQEIPPLKKAAAAPVTVHRDARLGEGLVVLEVGPFPAR